MTPARWGLVRAGTAVVAGVGLTYAAMQVPWTATLTPETSSPAAAAASLAPVSSNLLSCPGPESEGLQGVGAVAGSSTTVLAASPPASVLPGVEVAGTPGMLTVTGNPAGTPVGSTEARGQIVQGSVTGASVGVRFPSGPVTPDRRRSSRMVPHRGRHRRVGARRPA